MDIKRLRFQNPTVLNPENRVLYNMIDGGITIREVDEAIQEWLSVIYCEKKIEESSMKAGPDLRAIQTETSTLPTCAPCCGR